MTTTSSAEDVNEAAAIEEAERATWARDTVAGWLMWMPDLLGATHTAYRFAVEREKPDLVVVSFDGSREDLERTKLYPEYKSTREKAPDEMVAQFAGPAVPLGVQPMLPIRGAGGFVGGIRDSLLGGLRVHVEVPIPQGGRYVTEATVVLDNQARNGYRIVKWHEAGMNLTRSTNESGTAG